MGEMALVRSHLERCLQDIWDVCRVEQDGDGDYPFVRGTAMCFVRPVKGTPVVVQVFGYAVIRVERSGKLLKEINELNGRCRTVTVRWQKGAVIVEQVVTVDALKRKSLRQACEAVGFVANDIGEMIATVFGGTTPVATGINAERNEQAS